MAPEQLADRLERHLLGTEGPWDWDDTTCMRVADERLDALVRTLSRFDYLATQGEKNELANIVAALRRGEIPDA
jgi:hypothetical protein